LDVAFLLENISTLLNYDRTTYSTGVVVLHGSIHELHTEKMVEGLLFKMDVQKAYDKDK
jgi:hypothetical protein